MIRAQNGLALLTYKELGADGALTGREASFSDVDFLPLQYEDLVDLKLNCTVAVPLRWQNAKVAKSNIERKGKRIE